MQNVIPMTGTSMQIADQGECIEELKKENRSLWAELRNWYDAVKRIDRKIEKI